jgi:hypothetical protein
MESNDKVLNELRKFILDKYGYDNDIDRETSLYKDLGFYGDDIDYFFADLVKHFNIDVKKLDLTRYLCWLRGLRYCHTVSSPESGPL